LIHSLCFTILDILRYIFSHCIMANKLEMKSNDIHSPFFSYTPLIPLYNNIGLLQGLSLGRRRLSADFQLLFRLIEGSIFLTILTAVIVLIAVAGLTIKDILVCILAVMPTGWGLLLVSKYSFFFPHMFFQVSV